jgi:hypothetical protein
VQTRKRRERRAPGMMRVSSYAPLTVPGSAKSDGEAIFAAKDFEELFCYYAELRRWCSRSLDSLSVSRSGKSSGELSSVMIRNPKVGNSLEQRVRLNRTSQI